jgi:two-component system, OmpR family, sensor histidine kinase BaeS
VTAGPGTLSVTDTGPGIPAEDIPHAFERFYLYDKVGKDRPVGSGLGLAIVAQLARAMNGTVSVESAAGIGTTFLVELSGMPPSGTQLRGVDDLEVGAAQRAERV